MVRVVDGVVNFNHFGDQGCKGEDKRDVVVVVVRLVAEDAPAEGDDLFVLVERCIEGGGDLRDFCKG